MPIKKPYIDDDEYPLSSGQVTIELEGTFLDALKRVGEEMFYDACDVRNHKATTIASSGYSFDGIDYQEMHITFESGYCLSARIHPLEILISGWASRLSRVTHIFNLKNPAQISWLDSDITTCSLLEIYEDAFALVRHIKQLHEEDARPLAPRQYTGHQVVQMMESRLIYSAYRWLEPNIRLNYEYQDEFRKRVVMPSWTWNARKQIESMTQWERTNHIETELDRPDWVIGRYECIS